MNMKVSATFTVERRRDLSDQRLWELVKIDGEWWFTTEGDPDLYYYQGGKLHGCLVADREPECNDGSEVTE